MARAKGLRELECPHLHVAAALYSVELGLYALEESVRLAAGFAAIAVLFALLALAYSAAADGSYGVG